MVQEKILEDFSRFEWNKNVIVRSSSLDEDTQNGSQAGKCDSDPNVKGRAEFMEAVRKFMTSYGDDSRRNQIFVQPILVHAKFYSVTFTLELGVLGNYYVINYDRQARPRRSLRETGNMINVTIILRMRISAYARRH